MRTFHIFVSLCLPAALVGCQAHIDSADHLGTEEEAPIMEKTIEVQQEIEQRGGILYVDQNVQKEGNGRSWQTAYRNLQTGLDAAARTGAELWVAEGIYRPEGQERSASFTIADGVQVYGSILPGATEKKQDALRTPTILSGNIGSAARTDDNCYHVVSAGTDVVLDGVVIEGGFADGNVPDNTGGGLHLVRSGTDAAPFHLKLNRIIFRDNSAEQGGALFVTGHTRIEIDATYFRTNSALYGGAVMVMGGELDCNNVHFFANSAAFDAGAFSLGDGIQADLHSCLFTNNTAGRSGGAMQLRDNQGTEKQTRIIIGDTLFSGNRAKISGGAIDNRNGAIVELTGSHLHDNRAAKGGDIATYDQSQSKVTKCVFIEGRKDCYIDTK